MRSEQEIADALRNCPQNDVSAFPNATYEDGVLTALYWALGGDDTHPFIEDTE